MTADEFETMKLKIGIKIDVHLNKMARKLEQDENRFGYYARNLIEEVAAILDKFKKRMIL